MATKSNMVMCFVCPGAPARKICVVNHRESGKCKRPHEVPADALWSGEYPVDEFRDLVNDVKHHRKENRNALRRWQTKHAKLLRMKTAPAFSAFKQKALDDHVRDKPKFSFKPRRAV